MESINLWENLKRNKRYICLVCLKLFEDPVYCQKCSNCFCKSCVDLYVPLKLCPFGCEDTQYNADNNIKKDKDKSIECFACLRKYDINSIYNHKCFKCIGCEDDVSIL